MDVQGLFPVGKQREKVVWDTLLGRSVQGNCSLLAVELLIQCVFCDLAEPGLDTAVAAKRADVLVSLIEGLGCQFVGEVFIAAEGEQKVVDDRGSALKNEIKVIHAKPSFLLVLSIRARKAQKDTIFYLSYQPAACGASGPPVEKKRCKNAMVYPYLSWKTMEGKA